jgi:hypothetical protein
MNIAAAIRVRPEIFGHIKAKVFENYSQRKVCVPTGQNNFIPLFLTQVNISQWFNCVEARRDVRKLIFKTIFDYFSFVIIYGFHYICSFLFLFLFGSALLCKFFAHTSNIPQPELETSDRLLGKDILGTCRS